MKHDPFGTGEAELSDRRVFEPRRIAVSRYGMAATAHYRATEAAVGMLETGGNAVDAAVAAAFALGVCEPHASGIGGQTMMLIYRADTGKTIALDGSSRAPHRVIPGRYNRKELLIGHKATTVPSTPATLEYALKNMGRLKLKQVMAPAIRLAENGCEITPLQNALTKREVKKLRENPAGAIFLKGGKTPYRVGATFKQPELAWTLKRIARLGVKTFYRGKIAKMIHADMFKNGGLIRRDDLAQIPWPIERKPISGRFENMRVITFPPPAAGQVLIEMLNIVDRLPKNYRDPDTPRGALAIVEAIRRSNIDRSDRPHDPHFFPQLEYRKLISADYADKLAHKIFKKIKSGGETTHLTVMDRDGNCVALTQSIERVYGSCAASPELGFLYNNYMSAFEYDDINHPYYLRPNAVPWASVAPSIVFKGHKPWLAIGSPGSDRISSSILQVLLRLKKMSPLEAVAAPRLHCSMNGTVALEGTRMRDDILDKLVERGFKLDIRNPFSFYLGCIQMVMREGGKFIGVADPRRDGSAQGPRH